MNAEIVLSETLQAFIDWAESAGLPRRPAQSLVVPYFRGEFNRCVEHRHLNNLLARPVEANDPGWYQIGMSCRLGDTKKVEFGWHTTVFEMLTAIWRCDSSLADRAAANLAGAVIDLLVTGFGLDIERLRITYFGGGEVVPGLILDIDEVGRTAFRDVGVSEENLVPVRGPKNFVLFVGDGERVGPKYEIQYRLSSGPDARWVEVATAIVDCFVFRLEQGSWALRTPRTVAWGCAFGLERVLAARVNARSIWASPSLFELAATIREASGQEPSARHLLEADCLILADLLRSTMFLLSDGIMPDDTCAEGLLLAGLIRRIRRKVALLSMGDCADILDCLASVVVKHYEMRYPRTAAVRESLVHAVREVSWPEGWNPDSYSPGLPGDDRRG